jgi:hypothetical protein
MVQIFCVLISTLPSVTALHETKAFAQQRPRWLPLCSSTTIQDFDTAQLKVGLQ